MSYFVDTSVWSLAWRRDHPSDAGEVLKLAQALEYGESIVTTGLVLQELLQGFAGARAHRQITARFTAIPLLIPDRHDHIEAADLRNACRRKGIQVGTIDALFAQLCLRHELTLLTTDKDFQQIARVRPLSIWAP